jgi:hypothetical protein
MNIPFLSLKDITNKYSNEIHEAVSRVIDSGWYLQEEENATFEDNYSHRFISAYYILNEKLVGNFEGVRIKLKDVRAVFHRPHPQNTTDKGAVRSVRRFLENAGVTHD